MKDIVDEIDALVDASLARPIVDDYNADRYDKCVHCNRDWHGIPITAKIAEMYSHGTFDESYRVGNDDTEVLCQGSDFIGPMKAPDIPSVTGVDWSTIYSRGGAATMARAWLDNASIDGDVRVSLHTTQPTRQRWWRTTLPNNAEI